MFCIKQLRKNKKITQSELGKAVGVYSSTISQYESGKRSPSIEMLIKIASVLDCTIDELIDKNEKEQQ